MGIVVLSKEIFMNTVLERRGIFLLGILTGMVLSLSASLFFPERDGASPIADTRVTVPKPIGPAIERIYRPTHLESDLKLT